jgi:hypothetical protein
MIYFPQVSQPPPALASIFHPGRLFHRAKPHCRPSPSMIDAGQQLNRLDKAGD